MRGQNQIIKECDLKDKFKETPKTEEQTGSDCDKLRVKT